MSSRLLLVPSLVLMPGILAAEDAVAPAPAPVRANEVIQVTADEAEAAVVDYKPERTATAGFSDQAVLDTPFSIGVIGADLLTEKRISDIKDALKYEPAANLGYHSGAYNYFEVRGSIPTTLVDGAPYWNRARYSLENVEQVEFLKGPAALRGGFGGPGGAVNLVTKRPLARDATTVSGEADTWGGYRGTLDSSLRPLDGTWGVRLNAAYEGLDDQWDLHGHRVFIALANEWKINSTTTLIADIDYLDADSVFSGEYNTDANGDLVDLDPERLYGQPWTDQATTAITARIGVRHRFSESWSGDLQLAGFEHEEHWNATYMGLIQPNGDYDLYAYVTDPNTHRGFSATGSISGGFITGALKHDLVLAGQYSRQWHKNGGGDYAFVGTTNIGNPAVFPRPPVVSPAADPYHTNETSLVVTDEVHFLEYWSVLVGGRYSTYSTSDTGYDTSAIVPVAALIYKPVPNLTTYVSYSESLEPGDVAPAPATNEGEQLDARASRQYEIGAKAEVLNQRLLVTVAAFDIRSDYWGYIDGNGVYVQDGYQNSRGIEFAAVGRISDSLKVHVGGMLLEAILENTGDAVQDGERAAFIPESSAHLSLDYDLPWITGLSLSAGAFYTGEFAAYNYDLGALVPIDDVVTIDAGASYRFATASIPCVARLNVTNLFDKQGWQPAFYPIEPLTAKLSLEATF